MKFCIQHPPNTHTDYDYDRHQQVQLVSRDEQSILIVTYAELKHCLDQAFSELTANAAALP